MDVDEGSYHSKQLSVAAQSTSSVVSVYATALEVCESVYGEHPISHDALERFYESSASIYENPLVTTTSRTMLADILRFSRQLSVVDIPRPLAVIYSFFRLRVPDHLNSPWLHALRAWTEIDDVSESESFDGHRKTIVEHTLHILVFPNLHTDTGKAQFSRSNESLSSPPVHPIHPSLPIPGTSLTVPSPFHFELRILTRFSFNEQGRITHHRDFWDVKDVMGLLPGVSLAQWIGTRITARGLSYASRMWLRNSAANEADLDIKGLESGYATEYAQSTRKELQSPTESL
ncbi:hypothetical protein BDP27DRAFT_1073838 [Rhodocollybia butyracea]|uniref:Uncharacterized protein n=1 Tax=Rhodocollybia butyracea TaxID=206335 RepID=A0A9P5P3P5_9AGAR|nr:hypothetical protein BDP27DRAFT_1073838 [Rhodocollybia butyracea]